MLLGWLRKGYRSRKVMLLGLYLGKASVGSAYGAAGSLVALLVGVYYSAQIGSGSVSESEICDSAPRSDTVFVVGKVHLRDLSRLF